MTRAERASQIWAVLAWAARNRQVLTYGRLAKLVGAPPAAPGCLAGADPVLLPAGGIASAHDPRRPARHRVAPQRPSVGRRQRLPARLWAVHDPRAPIATAMHLAGPHAARNATRCRGLGPAMARPPRRVGRIALEVPAVAALHRRPRRGRRAPHMAPGTRQHPRRRAAMPDARLCGAGPHHGARSALGPAAEPRSLPLAGEAGSLFPV
jgi:hypothetical protein